MPTSGEIRGPLEFMREVNRVIAQIPTVKVGAPNFLPDTELPVIIHNFYLKGGIGDRLCALPMLVYVAKYCPWIWGRVWVDEIVRDIFENIIAQTGNSNWKVLPIERMNELCEPDTRVTGRGYEPPDGTKVMYAGNGAGGHLVDVMFMHHLNKFPPPKGSRVMPQLQFDLKKWPIKLGYDNVVIFTTGAVSPAREVPGHYWNPIIEHIMSRGFTPMFLGSNLIKDTKGIVRVFYADGCKYSSGIDLRDRTTLMEAAWLMKNARAVVGLDNGLLQIATLTNANIVALYNTVSPQERRPDRVAGRWEEVTLSKKELGCIHCQTDMHSIAPPHDFKRCLYGHLNCVHLLFENQGQRVRQALDRILI